MINRSQFGVVAFGFLLLGLVYQVQHTVNIFLLPISESLGSGRAAISAVFGVMIFFRAVGDAAAGYLSDRFGSVRVIRVGGVLLAAGLMAASRAVRPWHLFLSYSLLVGLGIALSGWIPTATAIRRRFHGRMSLAMGLATTGVGFSLLVVAPLLQRSILRFGWRATLLADGAFLLFGVQLMALLLALQNKRAPLPVGDPDAAGEPTATTRQALRSRPFWVTFAAYFGFSTAFQLLLAHQVAYLIGAGWEALLAASTVGMMGLVSLGMKPALGIGAERFGRRAAFAFGAANLGAAAALLLDLGARPGWGAGVYLYALALSIPYSMIPVVYPAIAADRFHGAAYGSIYGALTMASGIGAAAGVYGGGLIFDWTGGYRAGFLLATALALAACLLVWAVVPGKRASDGENGDPGGKTKVLHIGSAKPN